MALGQRRGHVQRKGQDHRFGQRLDDHLLLCLLKYLDQRQVILDGTPLIAPGADGINGVALANAILLSSWLGKEVELPVDEDLYQAELNRRIAGEGEYPTP